MKTGQTVLKAGLFILAVMTVARSGAVVPTPTSSTSKTNCGVDLAPSCADLERAPVDAAKDPKLGFPTRIDGGLVFNPAPWIKSRSGSTAEKIKADADLLKFSRVSPAQAQKSLARIRQIMKTASDVSGESVLKYVQLNLADANSEMCRRNVPAGFPNAYMVPETITLNVCPSVLNLTDAQLVPIILHELGHAASPCEKSKALYELQQDELIHPILAERDRSLFYDDESEYPRVKNDPALDIMLAEKPRYQRTDPSSAAVMDKLEAVRVAKRISLPVASEFTTTRACLAKQFSADYEDFVTKTSFGRAADFGISQEEAERQIRRATPSSCQPAAQEQFADGFAAKYLGAFSSTWKKADFQILLTFYQPSACLEKTGATFTTQSNGVTTYPPAQRRMLTLLNDDSTAARLGCSRPKDETLCPIDLKSQPASPAAPARKSGSQK